MLTRRLAIEHVLQWLSHNDDPRRLQANARRLAMTMGRALELSLLIGLAAAPLDLLTDINSEDSACLLE